MTKKMATMIFLSVSDSNNEDDAEEVNNVFLWLLYPDLYEGRLQRNQCTVNIRPFEDIMRQGRVIIRVVSAILLITSNTVHLVMKEEDS